MAVLKVSADTPYMLAVLVYDTKPVHLISTVSETVEWLPIKKNEWSATEQSMTKMHFLRLNIIDEYNHNMNSTDISDKL